MSRLAIVIAAQGNVPHLESGLVSVLEHRPPQCEIWIVLDAPYDDPYGLEGEVRFLHAGPHAGLAQSVNLALEHCEAPLVHLLGCGVEVSDGWADRALPHFSDPRVAAVASRALSADDRRTVHSLGVRYPAAGVSAGGGSRRFARQAAGCLGPSSLAGFYRAAVLRALGGLCPAVGDGWADVDLALSLRGLGMKNVCEAESIVFAPAVKPSRVTAKDRGLHAERLYRRHTTADESALRHALAWAADGWQAPLCWLGRLAARAEGQSHSRHSSRLLELRETLVAPLVAAGRIDPAHGSLQPATAGRVRQEFAA